MGLRVLHLKPISWMGAVCRKSLGQYVRFLPKAGGASSLGQAAAVPFMFRVRDERQANAVHIVTKHARRGGRYEPTPWHFCAPDHHFAVA